MANEKRLIDANELTDRLNHTVMVAYPNLFPGLLTAVEIVDDSPTVDAVEVVHGRWEDFCRGKMCCCSVCKAEFDNTCNEIHGEWYYCPNCGADMRERKDDGN